MLFVTELFFKLDLNLLTTFNKTKTDSEFYLNYDFYRYCVQKLTLNKHKCFQQTDNKNASINIFVKLCKCINGGSSETRSTLFSLNEEQKQVIFQKIKPYELNLQQKSLT